MKMKKSLKRWKKAQEKEADYWSESKALIDTDDHKRNKQSYAKDVSKLLTESPTIQIGGGADAMVNFMDSNLKIILDPLLQFYHSHSIGHINSEPICGVGEALPLKDNSVESIISFNMLDHVADPEAVIEEIGRIIRPGGRLFLMVHVKSLPMWTYRKVFKDPLHPSPLRRNRILQRLRSLGFSTIRDNSDKKTLRIFMEKG